MMRSHGTCCEKEWEDPYLFRLKRLNEAVKRENFTLPNFDDVSPKLAGAMYFSKLHASSEFYKVTLHEDSWKLSTCITPVRKVLLQESSV